MRPAAVTSLDKVTEELLLLIPGFNIETLLLLSQPSTVNQLVEFRELYFKTNPLCPSKNRAKPSYLPKLHEGREIVEKRDDHQVSSNKLNNIVVGLSRIPCSQRTAQPRCGRDGSTTKPPKPVTQARSLRLGRGRDFIAGAT